MGETEAMLRVDVHEPEESIVLMLPAIPCIRESLNEHGYADYMWRNSEQRCIQVERKTWGEVLAGMDKIENQLRNHKRNQPEARLLFLIEGIIDSDPSGTFVGKKLKSGIWTRGYRSSTSMARVYAWLYNIAEFVETYQTLDYASTCQFLVAAFKQDQKEEKKTFSRYFKPISFSENPQVSLLMGFPRIGEAKAQALIEEYVTLWRVLNASPQELARVQVKGKSLGLKVAVDLLRSVGRTNV